MDERQKENSTRGAALFAFAAAIAFLLAILTWGPWNVSHVASNDGPSGTPGSSVTEGRRLPDPPGARSEAGADGAPVALRLKA
jgi:hypothetical protein